MRRNEFPRLAGLALALSLAAGQAWAIQDCELNGASVNPANGSTTAGKTGLMRCRDRDSGELQREQELQNGKFMGLVRFYEKGKLAKEHSVNERGNMDGRAREFAPNGQVLREATYANGSYVGLVRTWYDDGQLRRATAYADNGNTELAVAEFNRDGKLSELRCGPEARLAPAVDDRKLCGFAGKSEVELFTSRGQLATRSVFEAGKRTRSQNFYDNGTPSAEEVVDAQGRTQRRFWPDGTRRLETRWVGEGRAQLRVLETEYSERGSPVREQRWADGRAVSDIRYYLNGQPKSRTDYTRDGTTEFMLETSFYDSGKPASESRYATAGRSRQLPVGVHKRWDESGRVASESTYDDKSRLTRERVWDEAGRVVRDDEVFEDGSRKAYTKQ